MVGIDNLITGTRGNVRWLAAWPDWHLIEQDIAEPLDVRGEVDLVADLACPASPADFHDHGIEILRTCSEGVRHLLELARRKGALFLHASTSEVYGDPEVHPQREDYWGHVNPIGPRSVYGEGKRFAEAMIMAYRRLHGLAVRTARVFSTYGPRMRIDDGRVVTTFIHQALQGEPLTVHGEGNQTRSFCYVDDLIDGLVRLARSDINEPVNLGNPQEIRVRELAEEILSLTGSTSPIESRPLPPDDPKLRRPDITRAREQLGWEPQVPRREGLRHTVNWCREVLRQSTGRVRPAV